MSKVAFVTGGAGGIGQAVVQALAADGHVVGVVDIDEDRAAAVASGVEGIAVACDLTVTDSVGAAVEQVEAELGPISILVNAAGWDRFIRFLDTDEEFWDRIIELNFKGCLRTCHRIVPGMAERGYGRIVNIGSDAARVGSSLEAVYSGAKGGVVAFTKALAREVARHGITANTVCPGPTDTRLLSEMAADNDQVMIGLERAIPLRRLAVPEDIAPAVAFLASEEAGFITGQTLSVSGGLTMA